MTSSADKIATIEDVAKLAQVSIATVSRVVHTPSKVAEATRKKVQNAIAKVGYTPNAMARNLRRRSSRMILVLLPDIGNPFFSNILSGIEEVARQKGYGVFVGNTDSNPEKEEFYLTYLRGGQADGVILLTGRLPQGATADDMRTLPPMVAISEHIDHPAVPFVGIDNVAAAKEATEHLLSLGHLKIAHFKGPAGNILTDQRLQGYQEALQAARLPLEQRLILEGDFSLESGQAAIERLASGEDLPTAIFCASDEIAIGALRGLSARGIAVPNQISVVGFDDIQFAACTTPPLTTVHQPRRRMGEQAMTLLLTILEKKTTSVDVPTLLAADLVVRQSSKSKG